MSDDEQTPDALSRVETADGTAVVTRAAVLAGRAAGRSTVSCEGCAWTLPCGLHADDDTDGFRAYCEWAAPLMAAHSHAEGHEVRVTVLVYATGEERVVRTGDVLSASGQTAEPASAEVDQATETVPKTWTAARRVEQALEQVEATRTVEVPAWYRPTPDVHAAGAAAQKHAAGLRRMLGRLAGVPLDDAEKQEAVSVEACRASTEAYRRVEEFWTLLRAAVVPE